MQWNNPRTAVRDTIVGTILVCAGLAYLLGIAAAILDALHLV